MKKYFVGMLVLLMIMSAVAEDATGVYVMYGHNGTETALTIIILNDDGTAATTLVKYDGTTKRGGSGTVGTWKHVAGRLYVVDFGTLYLVGDIYDWVMVADMMSNDDKYIATNVYYKLLPSDQETFIKQWEIHQQ